MPREGDALETSGAITSLGCAGHLTIAARIARALLHSSARCAEERTAIAPATLPHFEVCKLDVEDLTVPLCKDPNSLLHVGCSRACHHLVVLLPEAADARLEQVFTATGARSRGLAWQAHHPGHRGQRRQAD